MLRRLFTKRQIIGNSQEGIRMSGKIKIRKSNRIYTTVEETAFQVGDKYTYTYDVKTDTLVISKSEKGNTVSPKKVGSKIKPLIDIRNREMLDNFKDFEKIQIEILESKVLVTGYKEESVTVTTQAKREKVSTRQKKAEKGSVVQKKAETASVFQRIYSLSQHRRQKARQAQEAVQLSLDFNFIEQAVGESISSIIASRFDEGTEMNRVLKVLSICCGAGFSDYGLLQARLDHLSFEMVKAYDIDPAACETYRQNLGSHVEQQDIMTLDLKNLPEADIVFASPSCFGFSNHNRSDNQERKDSQNDLTRRSADIIKAIKSCKVFVIENVKQMLTAEKGKYLEYFKNLLSDFEITYGVLNAVDFGAPQRRERAFIIGSKIGRIDLPKPTHTPEMHMTVAEALEGCDDHLPNMTAREDCVKSSERTLEKIAKVSWGGNWEDLIPEYEKDFLFKKDGTPRKSTPHTDIYYKLHPYQTCKTIANFRKSCISHPFKNRILTVREACRLMGVPDHYEIYGKTAERIQQVANGVVPSVMTAIGLEILKAFQSYTSGGHLRLVSN